MHAPYMLHACSAYDACATHMHRIVYLHKNPAPYHSFELQHDAGFKQV